MNGTITVREGKNPLLNKGLALYGSDSGHQSAGFGGPPSKPLASGPTSGDEWALNDEAIRNMGLHADEENPRLCYGDYGAHLRETPCL